MQSQINLLELLQPQDYFVFGLLMTTIVAIVLWSHRRVKKSEEYSFIDYMLMGRALTLPLFVATLVATWYGGILGVTEIAFKHGIYNFVTQGVFWYASYLIFAFFIVHKLKDSMVLTLPELVKTMFGKRSAQVAGVFNFFNVVPVVYIISLGTLSQMMFGGSLWLNCLACAFITCFYTMYGGFRAVVFSDLVQFFLMCLAVFLVLIFSVQQYGGVSYLSEKLPATHFSLTGGQSLLETFAWGLIALSTLVDPNFYQRCFAATSIKTARHGIFISTVIWCFFDLCTTFGAMYAAATIPEADSRLGYLTYAMQLLGPGWRGFFLAGLMATILSTIDSYLFIASNTLVYDLGPQRIKRNLFFNRVAILLVGALAAWLAVVFDGSIKLVWKTLGSYSAGCLMIPVLVGYMKKNLMSDHQFVLTVLAAAVGITYWRLQELSGYWALIDDVYIGVMITSFFICFFSWKNRASV